MSTLAITNLKHASASGNNITLDSNGNVGIGGAAPSTNKLHIEGAGATRAVVYNSSNAVGVRIQALTGSGLIQTDTNHPLQFATNNGAVQMQVDTSGRVTMPYQPAFQAYRDAGHVANNQVVVFNSARFNIGGHYSTSTGKFTAPISGRYQFNTHTMLVSGISGDHQLSFRVNGSNYSTSNPGNGSFNVAFGLSEVIQLNAGDYIEVYYYDSTSNAIYGSGGANWTGFSGILLG